MGKMGTPSKSLQLLLSPRGLSPGRYLSPATTKTPKFLTLHHPNYPQLIPKARKKLDYASKNPPITSDISIKLNLIASPIRKPALVLNTPKKNDILKKGLSSLRELNILGMGGFGVVVRGMYKDKDVAVKVLKKPSNKPTREINALRLQHANVVRTLDVLGDHATHIIVVMEYLNDARVLQSILDANEFTTEQCLRCAVEIVQGLTYCHAQDVLHLDVKPANVLVTANGCKLCDFGHSAIINNTDEVHIFEGSVQYAAPEVLRGKVPTTASDVYSLGVLLWQLRARKYPYEGVFETHGSIIYNVIKFGLRPDANNQQQDDYTELYELCWQQEPETRPSLDHVKDVLLKLS